MTTRINHLYIHVPFCKTICSYCDFCHVVYNDELVNKWLDKLTNEFVDNETYDTIYIGGGTPTSLNNEQLDKLLSLVDPYIKDDIEYTIEVNPETIDIEKIKLLKKHGINRVSIGLQSTSARLLKLMNRHHNKEDIKKCVDDFKREGIDNISLDVMYSLPSQTMDDLKDTIDFILDLDVPHVSLYSLTIEENTVFGKKGFKPLDEDKEADMYEYIEKRLIDNNYIHYEIANFARSGYESKHNLGYWNYDEYRGIGPGSTGKYNHQRHVFTSNVINYLNDKDVKEVEDLTNKDEAFENIMMSLRTNRGLDLKLFKERYNLDFEIEYKEAIDKNKDNLIFKDGHCICNNLEILNSVLLDFME